MEGPNTRHRLRALPDEDPGTAGGLAGPLDESGDLPLAQIPSSIATDAELAAHVDDATAAHAASAISYTPAIGANWSDPDPTTAAAGLDALAGRVAAIEATPGGVTSFNTRTGAVTLSKSDVTGTGLTYSDVNADASGSASAAQAASQPLDALLTSIAGQTTSSGKVQTYSGPDAASLTAFSSSNTANAIVSRDGSGNFSAGTITASLTGTASGNDVLGAASSALSSALSALSSHTSDTTDAHAATAIGYTPTTSSDWSPTPSQAGGALDQVASRVKTLEGAGGSGVTSFNGRTGSVSPADGDYSQSLITGLKTSSSPSFVAITSSVATGTAPLTVSSTTKVANLNADMVDGYSASQTPATGTIPVTAASTALAAGWLADNSPATGNVLTYNGTKGVWQAPSGGGGGSPVGNISSGPNVIASGETRYLNTGPSTNPLVWPFLLESVAAVTGQTYSVWDFDAADEASYAQEDATKTEFTGGLERLQQTNDGYTALLLFFNDEFGSTTFIDTSGKTVTRSGNPSLTTSPAGYWGNACGFFDGTGDYLTVSSHADFALGDGDFTIEFRMYASVDANERDSLFRIASGGIVIQVTLGNATASNWGGTGNRVGVHVNYNGAVWALEMAGGINVCDSAWHHIAVVRQGTAIKLYVDGALDASGTVTYTYTQGDILIGGNPTDRFFTGYLDALALSKGIARYTAAFTPPSAEYTYITYASYGTAWYTYTGANIMAQALTVATIQSMTFTTSVPTGCSILCLYTTDGGSTWKNHSGSTVAIGDIGTSGSTPAQLSTLFTGWSMPAGSTLFGVAWTLYSPTYTTTPTISQITFTYDGPVTWKPVSDGSDWQVRFYPASNNGLLTFKRLAGTSATVWMVAMNGNAS